MEFEEQKPMDTLLDREIKQETDDFFENVKVEEFSEPIILKQETEEPLETVKTEPIDEKNSKKMIPKIEEVRKKSTDAEAENNKFFGFKNRRCSVCLQMYPPSLMRWTKMEEDKLVNMVGCVLRGTHTFDRAQLIMSKQCKIPICHAHFSETLNEIYKVINITNTEEVPLFSVNEVEKLMGTVNSICPQVGTSQFCDILNRFINRISPRKYINSQTEGDSNEKERKRHCSVCSVLQKRQYTKRVSMKDEKMIIMIGCILRGDYSRDQALFFMSRNMNSLSQICLAHLSDALNEIYKCLDIEKPEEIASCSDELMQNLMITVNSICPQVEKLQFCENLHGFVQRNITKKRKRPNTEGNQNQNKKQHNLRCAMCSQIQIRSHTKLVTMEEEKLIVMIGYILCGDYTIEEAKQFLSTKKPFVICHAHLVEVNNEIYKVLQINNPGGILSCSSKLMKKLMATVNAIYSWVTISSFQGFFLDFSVRNKKHLGITD